MKFGVLTLQILVGCVSLALAGTVAWGFIEGQTLRETQQDRDAARAALSSKNAVHTDAKRRECVQDAARAFHNAGYDETSKPSGAKVEDFTNHYSTKYDRCLVEFLVTDFRNSHSTDMRQIYDANERQAFGDYFWISSDTKKYWEQKPFSCRMTRPGQDQTFCSSTSEWEAFEREMMNS